MRDIAAELNSVISLAEVILDVGGEFPALTPKSEGKMKGRHGALEGGAGACAIDLTRNRWVCFKRKSEGCAIWHGGAVEWILSHKYQGERRYFREAVEELCKLYAIDITEDPLDTRQHAVYELLTELCEYWHEALMDNLELKAMAMETYGLSEEGLAFLKIGWAVDIPNHYFENKDLLTDAGLVSSDWEQPLADRITIPYFAYNQVVWVAGRSPRRNAAVRKYNCLYRTSFVTPRLYGFDEARKWNDPHAPLFITEGLFDAGKALNDGARTVAVGGVDMITPEVLNDVKALVTLLPEPIKYIVFDNEQSGKGTIGALAVAQKIVKLGPDPLILELPRPEGVKKVDLCDFLMQEGLQGLITLAREAVAPPNGEIEGWVPTVANIQIRSITKHTEQGALSKVYELLSCMNEVACDRYIKYLAQKKEVPPAILKKAIDKLRKERTKTIESRPLDQYPDAIKFGQDIRYDDATGTWLQHRCVWQPLEIKETFGNEEQVTVVLRPTLLTVRYPSSGGWVIESKRLLNSDKMPAVDVANIPPSSECVTEANQWSMRAQNIFSYVSFVESNGSMSVDVWGLFQELKQLLKDFVWLPNDMDYEVVVAYVMLSYVYSGFTAIPYLQFRGEAGSGKSQMNYFINEFAYNTIMTSNLTSATIFRISHALRGLLIIDEAERLAKPASDDVLALLAVCNGGYQGAAGGRGSPVLRCDTNDPNIIKRYDTYCPKVFVSTKGLPTTLASRSILIEALKVPKEHSSKYAQTKGFDVWTVTNKTIGQRLRDQLNVWGLTRVAEVMASDTEVDLRSDLTLYARDRQIWRPILAVLHHVYSSRKQPFEEVMAYACGKQQATVEKRVTQTFDAILSDMLARILLEDSSDYVMEAEGVAYLNPSKLADDVANEMRNERLWHKDYDLGAKVVGQRLVEMNSSLDMSKMRRLTLPHTTQRVRAYEFSPDRFTEYVRSYLPDVYEGRTNAKHNRADPPELPT